MTRCFVPRWLLAASCALLFCVVARAENWPQWRGPNGDGISGEKGLPTKWSATENVVWKLKMPGMSGATPAVWGDRIFVTSEEGDEVVLICVSTEGKELWKRPYAKGHVQSVRFMRGEGNQASPSATTDGKHVYVFAGTGDFTCFDFDGKEVWHFNCQDRYGKFRIQHGMHVTPLLHGDRLYQSLLHSNGWWVVALDKNTGAEVWKVKRESDARAECEQAYASPVLWHNGKDEYLIVHGCDYATAHSLKDGSEIWRLGDLNPKDHYNSTLRFVATPVAVADLIVVPTAKRGCVVAVKPEARGKIATGSEFEQWRRPNGTPDVPSPLVRDGLVYLCGESGTLTCLDAKSGKELYSVPLKRDIYRASPVYADGKIYCTARGGVFSVVKAGPTFEQLAKNELPDTFSASPAISGGRIYLRGWDTLYAIGEAGK